MAANLHQYDSDVEEEDYIDMEVTSFTNLVHNTYNNTREFEFQMSHLCTFEIDKTTSPADELFYKGKLLPLHLPPRLQMFQKLLEDYTFNEEFYSTPLATTPFESCAVSPTESCQVSKELNPKEFLNYSDSVHEDEKKRYWSKKLSLVKKASRGYLRSFFGKTSCSNESSCASSSASRVADEDSVLRYSRERPKKQSSGSISGSHRRSYSVSTRRQPEKSSNSEIENSIQGAILYCKQSQEQKQKQCSVNEVGFCSLSASRIVERDDQERAKMFRG